MPRCPKNPLRPFTDAEYRSLQQLSRARSASAAPVAWAKALLAVQQGASYAAAAHAAGRRSGDAISHLVTRFNQQGRAALDSPHGGGPPVLYTTTERTRILTEVQRAPDREQDGTATWSLTTLQRALQRAPDGLPHVSRFTIWAVLRDSGWSWPGNRSWCPTGTAVRKRKTGVVTVQDPDTTAKKT